MKLINTKDVNINVLINPLNRSELVKLASSYAESIRFLKRFVNQGGLSVGAKVIIDGLSENLDQVLGVMCERIKKSR